MPLVYSAELALVKLRPRSVLIIRCGSYIQLQTRRRDIEDFIIKEGTGYAVQVETSYEHWYAYEYR